MRVGLLRQALAGWLATLATVTLTVTLLGGCAGQGARPNATPTATRLPTPTATPDPWTTKALSLKGTQIVNTSGQPVTLLGAARFSLEFECRGDGHLRLADFLEMRTWGMNTVRLPLSSAFWRNLGGACPTYRATVVDAVASAEAAGLYVILDLQRGAPFSEAGDGQSGGAQCPLPDAHDLAFWQDLAQLYNNDPRVIFDLFGEPYDIDWSQWWNGGPITSKCHAYATAATYQGISMPALATAVRAIAPRNLIILSGLDWGYDLSGISASHAVNLPNILYGTHPWDHITIMQPSDWQRAFGATASQLPVIASEFGQYNCQTDYTATAISTFEQLHISFLAWAWTPGQCDTPALIAGWDGEPTQPYGAYIQQQMLLAAKANPPGF